MKAVSNFVLILCCLSSTGWCFHPSAQSATLRGILYSDQGGPSASGTGEIRLAVRNVIYTLAYQKPYKQTFSGQDCRRPGAIWIVEAKIERDRVGNLLAASCTGERDESISAAVQIVADYFDFLIRGRYAGAYQLFSASYKSSHNISGFTAQARKLDLSLYKTGPKANCLEVLPETSADRVFISAGLECYITIIGQRAPTTIVFHVVRQTGSSIPEIADVKTQPQ